MYEGAIGNNLQFFSSSSRDTKVPSLDLRNIELLNEIKQLKEENEKLKQQLAQNICSHCKNPFGSPENNDETKIPNKKPLTQRSSQRSLKSSVVSGSKKPILILSNLKSLTKKQSAEKRSKKSKNENASPIQFFTLSSNIEDSVNQQKQANTCRIKGKWSSSNKN